MLVTVDNFLDKEDFFNLREIAHSDSLRWETQASSRNLSKRNIFDYSEIICENSDCIRLSESKFFISIFNLVTILTIIVVTSFISISNIINDLFIIIIIY